MYIFVEMWNAKPAWLDLPGSERTDYIMAVGGAIENLIASGVEIITWSFNDRTIDHYNGYEFFAVWRFPDPELVKTFQNIVFQAGWYDYFDQVNACGLEGGPEPVLDYSIQL